MDEPDKFVVTYNKVGHEPLSQTFSDKARAVRRFEVMKTLPDLELITLKGPKISKGYSPPQGELH